MESIQEPNSEFQFSNLILTPPINSTGGNHFMRFSLNDNPLYIQAPKCRTKQVAIKSTGKRGFLDLTFTNEHEEFVQWVENLEAHCQKYIYSKRERWFDSTLEESDIENLFTSILKPMKMGKFFLLRANTPLATTSMKIYDENENLMNLEELKEDSNIICILEFQGIKCSARGFQVEIEVKQILVLKPTNIFDRCVLNRIKVRGGQDPPRDESVIPIPMASSTTILNDIVEAPVVLEHTEEQEEQDKIVVNIEEMNKNDIMGEEKEEQADTPLKNGEEKEQEPKLEENLDTPKNQDLLEIDLNLEEVPPEDSMVLKQRNDVYYEMYKEALKKAKMAKDLALSSYLEAKRIKNIYMLDDLSDDSDLEDLLENTEDGGDDL